MKNKIELPRGYLSWSQLSLWEKNPQEYINQYIYGMEGFKNSAMDFGSMIAKALEDGESSDEGLDMFVASVPKYKQMEYEIKVKFDGIELFGKIDSYNPKSYDFIEYKTGVTPWTQEKVKKHGQLHFYAFMIYQQKKKCVSSTLIWLPTKKESDTIELTGETKIFTFSPNLKEIIAMGSRIKKASEEISKVYKEYKLTQLS